MRQQVLSEVSHFLMFCHGMNWLETIRKYPTDLFKEECWKHMEGKQWWKQCRSYATHNNINELWQYSIAMQWWNGFGRQYDAHVMMVAAINLARPYSNAQQKCDVSMATWFGGYLVQRQKPKMLEMMLVGVFEQVGCSTNAVPSSDIGTTDCGCRCQLTAI